MRKALSVTKPLGFTTPEVLLAAAIFGVIVTGLIGALVYGLQSTAISGTRDRAANIAKEGLEAVRSIRDDDFANINAGTFGLALVGSEWTFSGSSDTINGFTRVITITSAGTDLFEVTSTVTWTQTAQRNGTISFTMYLSNWTDEDTTAPASVSNLSLSGETETSIDLSWTAPGDDGSNGTAASYDVRYSTSPINDGNWGSATQATGEPSPAVAGSTENLTVSGLADGTAYYFAIKTSDEVPNESTLSNIPTATTITAATEADDLSVDTSSAVIPGGSTDKLQGITVENVGAGNITIDKITVTWTDSGRNIERIKIDGTTVWRDDGSAGSPSGTQPSGTELDINDFALSSGSGVFDIDYFRFDGDMTGNSFTVTFTMSDASTKLVTVFGPDTTAPDVVTDLATSGETGATIDLSWTAPGDDANAGTATSYDVRYSTSSIDAGNWAAATQATGEPPPSVAGATENFTVTGLSATTTYYFAIKTSDEVPNEAALSNVPTATTTAAPTEADDLTINVSAANIAGGGNKELRGITIENIGGSDITVDKITVTWSNGQLIEEIKIDGTRIWKHNNEGSPSGRQPTGTEIDVVDFVLSSGAGAYGIDKFKFDGDMTGDSFTITFTMSDASTKMVAVFGSDTTAPDDVTDLTTSGETGATIDLSWTAPGDDGATGTATSYDVRYSTSVINAGNWGSATQATGEPSPAVAGTAESFTVTGLSPTTTYYFAIKTSDEVPNESGLSNVPSATTTVAGDTTPPDDVADLATSNEDYTTIDLDWTAPGDDGATGTATTYDIRYSTSVINAGNWGSATQATGEPSPAVAGTAESFTVTSLSANTTYYFAIKTSDEVPNESGISNVPTTSTLASEADYLSIDTSGANIAGGGNKELRGITITNISGSDITVDKITVTWSNGQLIEEIKIDGTRIWKHNNEGSPSGRQPTGTEIDVVDFVLSSGAGAYGIDKFKFDGDMTGDTFSIKFTMSDTSSKTVSGIVP